MKQCKFHREYICVALKSTKTDNPLLPLFFSAQTNLLSSAQFALLTHPLLQKTSEKEGVQTRSIVTCTDGIYHLPDDVSQKHEGVGYVKHLAVDREFTKETEIWHYCATKNYL
jgi:hypothetical protein